MIFSGDDPSVLEIIGGLAIAAAILWPSRHSRAVQNALTGAVLCVFVGINGMSVWLAIDALRAGNWIGAAFAGVLPGAVLLLVIIGIPSAIIRDWRWRRSVARRKETPQ